MSRASEVVGNHRKWESGSLVRTGHSQLVGGYCFLGSRSLARLNSLDSARLTTHLSSCQSRVNTVSLRACDLCFEKG